VGQDYAEQRYYGSGTGGFWSPDLLVGNAANPGSLNRYAYVQGDPINFNDPAGEGPCEVGQPIPCTIDVAGSNDSGIPGSSGSTALPELGDTGDGWDPGGAGDRPDSTWADRNRQFQSQLKAATTNLSKPCQTAIATDFGASTLSTIATKAGSINFYDAETQYAGNTLISAIVPGSTSTRTLFQASQGVNAFVPSSPTTGTVLPIIVLAPTFFSALNSTLQTNTLIHEALHALGIANDVQAATDAGVYTAGMTSGQASMAFQRWLNNGCPGSSKQ